MQYGISSKGWAQAAAAAATAVAAAHSPNSDVLAYRLNSSESSAPGPTGANSKGSTAAGNTVGRNRREARHPKDTCIIEQLPN